MALVLLDTDILSEIVKLRHPVVRQHVAGEPQGESTCVDPAAAKTHNICCRANREEEPVL